jgi:hypothetical protein
MTNKLVVIINSLKYKLQLPPEPLTRGLPPPDPRSLCPLSSTQFVEPPPEQNSWVRHWPYLFYVLGLQYPSGSLGPQYVSGSRQAKYRSGSPGCKYCCCTLELQHPSGSLEPNHP